MSGNPREPEVDPTPAADPRAALLGVYGPPDTLFVSGRGSELFDSDGRGYLDFTSGIGVNALGFGASEVREAIEHALDGGLIHTSNLFRTRPAEELATRLIELSFPGRVFFCNSGAEAGEAALKFARRRAREVAGPGKHEIISFHGGFHGRLFGTLATTDRPAYREPFEPLMPGAVFCNVGDIAGVERVASREKTAAIMIEPVQGEGGVVPVPAPFLRQLRELCDEREIVLVFDEVQCGVGRSGHFFAYEPSGVRPDIVTLAKPLAGGLPMGAVILAEGVAQAIRPGDHATTFGGGPLVAAAALAVVEKISRPDFLEEVRERARLLDDALAGLADRHPDIVEEVRGVGLMRGVAVRVPAADIATRARALGLLVVPAGPKVVRLLPPLNSSCDDLRRGIRLLEEALG